MKIPRNYVDALTIQLNRLSDATKASLQAQLMEIEYTSISDLREKVLAIVQPLFAASTDIAAALAAVSYDLIRSDAVGEPINATAHSGRIPEATEGAVRALVGKVETSSFAVFLGAMLARADYEIKRAAAESTLFNAQNDPEKPRYARVPTGTETCPFCIMLASRGFVYHTAETAGALNHFHPNCKCRIIPGFQGMEVDGYDPVALYDQYREALKSGKLKLKNVNKNTSHVLHWNSKQFKTAGDFSAFILKADNIDDLQQRCAVVEQEFEKSGLSDKYYQQIVRAVDTKKNELIKTTA